MDEPVRGMIGDPSLVPPEHAHAPNPGDVIAVRKGGIELRRVNRYDGQVYENGVPRGVPLFIESILARGYWEMPDPITPPVPTVEPLTGRSPVVGSEPPAIRAMYAVIHDEGRPFDLASCDRIIAGLTALAETVAADGPEGRGIRMQLGSFISVRDINVCNGLWRDPDHWSQRQPPEPTPTKEP